MVRGVRRRGRRLTIILARVLLGLQDPDTGANLVPEVLADHVNRNPLDNRRGNLRRADHELNAQNRGARGVSSTAEGRYRARRMRGGRRICLGTFDTEAQARAAYEAG